MNDLVILIICVFIKAFNMEETMAISNQVMNINNYRIVLEEIIKADNIDRHQLPTDIDQLVPTEQVNIRMNTFVLECHINLMLVYVLVVLVVSGFYKIISYLLIEGGGRRGVFGYFAM